MLILLNSYCCLLKLFTVFKTKLELSYKHTKKSRIKINAGNPLDGWQSTAWVQIPGVKTLGVSDKHIHKQSEISGKNETHGWNINHCCLYLTMSTSMMLGAMKLELDSFLLSLSSNFSCRPSFFSELKFSKTACGVITELLPFGTSLHQILKQ